MDSKELSVSIGTIIIIVLSLTAFYSTITSSSSSDLNAYTAVIAHQSRANIIYLASLKSGVIKMSMPAKYEIKLTQNDISVTYKGHETSSNHISLNHGLTQKIKESKTTSKEICMSKHLNEECDSIIEICNSGDSCCSPKPLDCGTGNTK